MAASNHRVKEQDTIHHITSRVAHRVYILEEVERNDLVEMIRRTAEFCGIRLLAWCVLSNHFHLLIHLPPAVKIDEEEVLRRYSVLNGQAPSMAARRQLTEWRKLSASGERMANEWLDAQRRRMYDVGEYMKIVKQWCTEEYNRRHSHVGTLWESVYQDVPVAKTISDMAFRMGYVHLNPIRAAAASTYEGYRWSSFAAFARHDGVAEAGMRFVYDDAESSVEELHDRHVVLLDELLEEEKRKRSEEIVRKRSIGYRMPEDPLTDEAMIVQAAARAEMIRKASEELKIVSEAKESRKTRLMKSEKMVLDFLRLHPDFEVGAIAESLEMPISTVYRQLRHLIKQGKIERWRRTFVVKEV